MTLQTWWLYLCAVFVICATPGPNMLHILTRSVRYGLRPTMAAMAGCLSAIGLACAASAAGLGTVLTTAPMLFDAIKYAGVVYLVYLGVKSWQDKTSLVVPDAGTARTISAASLFRGGFLVAISNPKLIIFVAAFFPQFIDKSAPKAPQFVVLVATFTAIEMFWYTMYGLGGRRLARLLTRASWQLTFNRVTGAIFIGFGGALLGYHI